MSDVTDSTKLNSCGCCETERVEPSVENPPGQPALDYRAGTHSTFLRRMITRLSRQRLPDGENAGQRPLAALTTRADDDPAIALLDAWAVVGDVLTFYQERLANEGYLRTATERRSVLELARAIGYTLSPGLAAETHLAFTVDETEGSPHEARIPAGTQVQSIPAKAGELPQTFETAADFDAKAWWNTLRPQSSELQTITLNAQEIYLKGTGLNLTPGDRMLLIASDSSGKVSEARRKRVRGVEIDRDRDYTLVTFESAPGLFFEPPAMAMKAQPQYVQTAPQGMDAAFNEQNIDSVLDAGLSESQLQAILKMRRWNVRDLLDYTGAKTTPALPGGIRVFVLRESAGIFGHNAPYYLSLPAEIRGSGNAWPHPWDDPDWDVWTDSTDNTPYSPGDLYLERPVSGIVKDSWLLLERRNDYRVYRINEAFEASRAGFGVSAKVTGLELNDPDGGGPDRDSSFKVRRTTAYVKSEELVPALLPVTGDLNEGDTLLTLDGLVPGLREGQAVAVTGEQADAEGVERSEIKVLDTISHGGGYTTLKFTEGLRYGYTRNTVVINANVVRATHGETVPGEALGSGNGAVANQRFRLKRPPLTYVSATTASGGESTLSLRVNKVEWQEVSSLYGLDGHARSYIVRINNDAEASVIFGDGRSGARLPTGQENVVAAYRSGIGSAGEVGACSLTLMKTRPFGVRSVTNPTDASGADDPENLDDARENAPLTALTLDRIVSLQDFEDFARAFAGIGKAQAVALWNEETELVHITVADADGDEVSKTSDLFKNLRDAVNKARDPLRAVEIGSFQPRYFELDAKVWPDPVYKWEDVKREIESALLEEFSFTKRAFGQPVTMAEVLSVIHAVEGVVAVDVEKLYALGETGLPVGVPLSTVLPARRARPNPAPTAARPQRFLPAEILLINESGITLTEMEASPGGV
jgi:predicted phage baseplate assembly protein